MRSDLYSSFEILQGIAASPVMTYTNHDHHRKRTRERLDFDTIALNNHNYDSLLKPAHFSAPPKINLPLSTLHFYHDFKEQCSLWKAIAACV